MHTTLGTSTVYSEVVNSTAVMCFTGGCPIMTGHQNCTHQKCHHEKRCLGLQLAPGARLGRKMQECTDILPQHNLS